MAATDSNCSYVLDPTDPETWGGEPGNNCHVSPDVLDDGVWSCPHESGDNGYCLFHRPVDEKDDHAVVETFIDAVNSARDSHSESAAKKTQFLGARFGEFDLGAQTDSLSLPAGGIDLSYARVDGRFDWSGVTLDMERVYFIGTTFADLTAFESTTFADYVAFLAANFEGPVSFENARVGGEGDFRAATVRDEATFTGALFEEGLDVSNATFFAVANFDGVHISGDAQFKSSEFKTELRMVEAKIDGDADFMNVNVYGSADFESIDIAGERTLQFAEFGDVGQTGLR